jgi:hypothetical protein
VPTPTATNTPFNALIGAFGVKGTAVGELDTPNAVCVDNDGYIYVNDATVGYINKFNNSFVYQLRWGTSLNGSGILDIPYFITNDSSSNIYLTEPFKNRITKFDSEGNILNYWGTAGTGQGQFAVAMGICIYNLNVYVLDANNKRVQAFDSVGTYISEFSLVLPGDPSYDTFYDLEVDGNGNLYILDTELNCIKKFSNSGVFIKKWGNNSYNPGGMVQPKNIAIYNNLFYVTDYTRNQIVVFDTDGNFKYEIKGYFEGGIYKNLSAPEALAVDSAGNIYVSETDTGIRRIVKLSGTPLYN